MKVNDGSLSAFEEDIETSAHQSGRNAAAGQSGRPRPPSRDLSTAKEEEEYGKVGVFKSVTSLLARMSICRLVGWLVSQLVAWSVG